MCDLPQSQTAEAPTAQVMRRFEVGDEIEIRVQIVKIDVDDSDLPYRCFVVNGDPRRFWFAAADLAAGRLVATRPLAVGDRIRVSGSPASSTGVIRAIVDRDAWVWWDFGVSSIWSLPNLERAAK